MTLACSGQPAYSDLGVLVTEGHPASGQLRKVAVNASASTFTIAGDKPFTIVPDTTSRWTLYAPLRNATIYRNTVRNCAKGIWLYGNAYDDLAAENSSLDSAGIYLHTVSSGGISSGVLTSIAPVISRGSLEIGSRDSHAGEITPALA